MYELESEQIAAHFLKCDAFARNLNIQMWFHLDQVIEFNPRMAFVGIKDRIAQLVLGLLNAVHPEIR